MDKSKERHSDCLFIVFNKDGWNVICDLVKQTCFALVKKGFLVVSIEFYDPIKFIDVIFLILSFKSLSLVQYHDGVYLFRPILFPFSNRSHILYQYSIAMNCILLEFIFWIRYPKKKKYLWIIFPQFYWIAKYFFRSYKVIYDIVDYFTSPSKIEAKKLEFIKKKLLQTSDYIFSNSYTLRKIYQRYTKIPIHIVPQGFRLDEYGKQTNRKKVVFNIKKPIIGFIGGINERLDTKLLLRLILNHLEWQFMFAGVFDNDANVSNLKFFNFCDMLKQQQNVTFLLNQNSRELISFLRQCDICIIPYDVSQDFNRYCYPMKLFEYFYMEKPVIATPIEELKRFPKYVKIGRTAEEWENHIQTLFVRSWSERYQKEERKLAIENSWGRKINIITSYFI